jgi:hypothetical protein
VDKVVAFYKEKLKFEASKKEPMWQLVGRTPQGADVLMFVSPDGSQTKIAIRGVLYKKP